MTITATHLNYYNVCHRKLWLFSNGIRMEHTSELVGDGKMIHETSYPQRPERYSEIELSASFISRDLPDSKQVEHLLTGKIDFYDSKARVIHETKRSNKMESAHEWQSKFYIWLFQLNGIEEVQAVLEYPKIRERKHVVLTSEDRDEMQRLVVIISDLQKAKVCPSRISSRVCKSCSYHDLCYIDEP